MKRPHRMYATHTADATWCKCDVCGEQASFGIDVIPAGASKRGKRSLGTYCRPHGEEKLVALRKKR